MSLVHWFGKFVKNNKFPIIQYKSPKAQITKFMASAVVSKLLNEVVNRLV